MTNTYLLKNNNFKSKINHYGIVKYEKVHNI